MIEHRREEKEDVHLEWKDYLAIIIAMFETVLIPLLVALVLLVVLVLILRL